MREIHLAGEPSQWIRGQEPRFPYPEPSEMVLQWQAHTLCGGNHPFVRVLALAFTSGGPAGKSCSLICETVAG